MSADAIRIFNDRSGVSSAAKKFDVARSHVGHILRIEKLTRHLRNGAAVRLLDFGCGFGEFLLTCERFGFEVVGVDRPTPRIAGAVVNVHPSLGDLNGVKQFHAITLFEVFEHLDDPAEVLKQLSERLMSGGLLILETPDCNGVTGIKTHDDYLKVHPLEHVNAFTHETLKSIAERTRLLSYPTWRSSRYRRTNSRYQARG
jgi:2-polyprenyl-3-methyl-5-hydroxy-6-metoxy-1,4-benzoquinol methylase